MSVQIKMRTVWPRKAKPRPKPPRARPFGYDRAFKAIDISWREYEGAVHTVAMVTGETIPEDHRSFYSAARKEILEFVGSNTASGRGIPREFFVLRDGARIGRGFFPAAVEAEDIVHFITKMKSMELDAAVRRIPQDKCVPLDPYPATTRAMPAFNGPTTLKMRWKYFATDEVEEFSISPGAVMPQIYAGMFFAQRAAYEKILNAITARAFMIYDLDHSCEEPTQMFEARGDGNLKLDPIGEIDAGGGGFEPIARGNFDFTRGTPKFPRVGIPAETLAHISTRLAAEGRWLTLVPHEDDFLSDEIAALCSST
jgi:hypothetical protein